MQSFDLADGKFLIKYLVGYEGCKKVKNQGGCLQDLTSLFWKQNKNKKTKKTDLRWEL